MVIFLRRGWILCFCIVLLGAVTAMSFLRADESVAAAAPQTVYEERPVYVLDAGHGGADGGAVSQSGVAESEINLGIVLRMRELFALLGWETVLTRADAHSLADDPSATLRQQKISDTQNRVERINSVENGRLISIHQNALAGHPSVHGAQVFYRDDPVGASLAEDLQKALNRTVNVDNGKNIKPISDDVYLMSHVTCPAVLVECGFLSNEEEAELLQDEDYQTLLALILCCAAIQS